MDSSMMSAALAGPTMDLNEDSLDAPPSVSSTEAGPVMGTPSTPGTPAPSGKDKKVSVFSYFIVSTYDIRVYFSDSETISFPKSWE